MTVAELSAWLDHQDQGATVEVVKHTSGHTHYDQGGNIRLVEFLPEEHAEYTDLRGNPYIKSDNPCFEKRTLLLGSYDN